MNTTNTLADLAEGVSTASGGVLPLVLLLAIFFIIFSGTIRNGTSTAVISAGLVTTFSGLLMWWIGMIGWSVAIVPFVLFIVGIVIRFFQGNPGG